MGRRGVESPVKKVLREDRRESIHKEIVGHKEDSILCFTGRCTLMDH